SRDATISPRAPDRWARVGPERELRAPAGARRGRRGLAGHPRLGRLRGPVRFPLSPDRSPPHPRPPDEAGHPSAPRGISWPYLQGDRSPAGDRPRERGISPPPPPGMRPRGLAAPRPPGTILPARRA